MSFTESLEGIVNANRSGLLSIHNDWKRVEIGKIASIQNGFAFKSSLFSTTGKVALIRIRDILKDSTQVGYDGDYDDAYLVRFGDLLIGMDGDFNSSPWKGPTGLLNQRVCRVILNESFYSKKLLAYVIPGYLKEINNHTSAVTVKHLSSRTIAQIPLPLPSLNEQERMVDKIEELFSDLDAGVAALEVVRKEIKRYRQTVLKSAFEGKLTTQWREENKDKIEPASKLLERIAKERENQAEDKKRKKLSPLDTSTLPILPDEWDWEQLDAIADVKGGITKDQKKHYNGGRTIPYLRVANVQRGYLDLSIIKEIEASEDVINTLQLKKDDVLFTEGGDRDKLGRGCVWKEELPECIHQNHIFRARLFSPDISSQLISWFGNSFGQYYFMREGKQTTNLASINLTKLRAFPIPIIPIIEQKQIVGEIERRFSIAEKAEKIVEQGLKQSQRLRQSILKKAFEGKLVPQDPNEEPAQKLLERIKSKEK